MLSFSNHETDVSTGQIQPRMMFFTATTLAVLGLVVLLYLAQQSHTKINDFRSSQLDNSTWLVAQLEVDHLKLQRAILIDTLRAEQTGDYRPARDAFLAFDIYYSRVQVLSARFSTLSEFKGLNDAFNQRWQVVETDLAQMARIFDDTTEWDAARLHGLQAQMERHADNVRQITVLALKYITTASSDRFDSNMSMARSFAFVAVFMVVVLGIIIAIAGKLASDLAQRTRGLSRMSTTLKRTFNAAQDAIVLMDANGKITSCNRAAQDLFGRNRDQMVGREACRSLVPPRFADKFRQEFGSLDEPDRTSLLNRGPMRILCNRENGSEFIAEVVSVPEIDGQGKPIVISFFRDVSKQAQTEQLLRNAKLEAERLARNKERFLAVVSHELRTPLHGITAALELMSNPQSRNEELQDLVSTAQVSATSAREILDEVLEATEVNLGKNLKGLDAFDPSALVSEIITQVQPVATLKSTTVTFENSWSGASQILVNRKAFRYALTNLVRNATKFTENGTVEVRMCESPTQPGQMRIEVEDTGIGISQHDQQRIFEDFETAEQGPASDISGTGLGLGIFKRAVDALGGRIGVQSSEGWGSLFWFEFPYLQAPDSKPDQFCSHEPAPILHRYKVLVVDDNSINRLVISKMLGNLGQDVELAENGPMAIDLASRTRFDIVLMDLNMPGMNGRECATRLRQTGLSQSARIVAVTANVGTAGTKAGCDESLDQFGFETMLLKPFSLQDLRAVLGPGSSNTAQPDPDTQVQAGLAKGTGHASGHFVLTNLQDLNGMIGTEKTRRIVTRTFEDAHAALCAVKEAELPTAEVADLVHSAIGSLGMIGAQQLHHAFRTLEDALRLEDADSVEISVPRIEIELSQCQSALEGLLSDALSA